MPRNKYKIVIDQIEESYVCSEDLHLLAGMVSMGKRGICSGCHGGGCGVCKIKILQGEIETLVMSSAHVSKKDQEKGIVLACRAFPRSDIRLKVIGKLSKKVLNPTVVKKYGFI